MPQPSALHRFAHSATTRDAARLLSSPRCKHIYLDTGSNLGVQIRKIYEPLKYWSATVEPHFAKYFGEAPRCAVCSIGIEPNPRHFARHGALERRLGAAGAKVAFVHAAAAVGDGEAKLWMPAGSAKDKNEDWGATIAVGGVPPRGLKAVTTPLLNLSSLLLAVGARPRAASGRVVMKLVRVSCTL